jgi:hypothetical protein
MTYTFKINKISTKQNSPESNQIIQAIHYDIIGTNDSSPEESAAYPNVLKLQDSSPEIVYNDSLTEDEIIAVVRAKYDSDEDFRNTVNTHIDNKIVESRPTYRMFRENDLPWASE